MHKLVHNNQSLGSASLQKKLSLIALCHFYGAFHREGDLHLIATEFPTGDVDQYLHKSGSHGLGVPNLNLSDFKFLLGKSAPAKLKCFL